MKTTILLLLSGSLLLSFSGRQSKAEEVRRPATEGFGEKKKFYSHTAVLPQLKMFNADGKLVNLVDFKGKKLLLNFWASWCPPCRKEMPSLQKLWASVDSSKAAFVLLSLDDDPDKAAEFLKKSKLKLPVYFPAENLPAALRVAALPTTFIFDETGNLVTTIEGSENYNSNRFRKLFQ